MKLFEDLPSQNMPITAENLNQIQDNLVVVSATEPTGDNREKVWIQKGKNLIKGYRAGYGFNTINGQYEFATMFSSTEAIDVQVGQTYIFSHSIGHIGGAVQCLDANNNHVETLNQDTITSPFTITNPNCKKVVIVAWDPNNNASVNETWMQLEQNTVATAYEAYIEPKIYVKNNNGMYEKFISKEDTLEEYSTTETRIGTWIDGKPLYRKVGYVGNTAISENETTVRYCELPADAKPVNVNAVVYTETSGYALFVNSSYSENGFKIRYINDIHSIQVIATPDVALEKSFSAYVIMEYIKTTD